MLKAILLLVIFLLAGFLYGLVKIRFFPPSMPESTFLNPGAGANSPLVRHVRELSRRIGSRSFYEYEKLAAAKDYLTVAVESWGLVPEFQRYEYGGREYSNIVVTLPGSGADPAWLVVGAHYVRYRPVPVETLCAPLVFPGIDFSDHRSFWKMGYPAVMITDTAFYRNPLYHTPQDTMETLDIRRMGELLPGLVAMVGELAGGEEKI